MVDVGSVDLKVRLNEQELNRDLTALRSKLAALNDINIKVDFDSALLQSEIKNALQNIDFKVKITPDIQQPQRQPGGAGGGASSNLAQGVLQGVGQGLVGLGAGALQSALEGVSSLAQGTLAVGSAAESAEISFSTFLGSVEAGQAAIQSLRDFAANTPFEFPEIRTAGQNLIAFGFSAEELIPTLTSLGDIAAGVGIPITELADIYGKARTQGRLFAEDINQLTGRGIPITAELAKQFGVTEAEVRGLVEAGKVGFPQLQQAFQSLTSEGGKFAGLMAGLAQSVPGQISNLSDAFDAVQLNLFESVRPAVSAGIGFVSDVLSELKDSDVFESINRQAQDFADTLNENTELSQAFADAIGEGFAAFASEGISLAQEFTEVLAQNPDLIRNTAEALGDVVRLVGQSVKLAVDFVTAISKGVEELKILTSTGGAAGEGGRNAIRGLGGDQGDVDRLDRNIENRLAQERINNPFGFIDRDRIIQEETDAIATEVQNRIRGNRQDVESFGRAQSAANAGQRPRSGAGAQTQQAQQPDLKSQQQLIGDEEKEAIAGIRQQQAARVLSAREAADQILQIERDSIQKQIDLLNSRLQTAKAGSDEEIALKRQLAGLEDEQAQLAVEAQERTTAARLDAIERGNREVEARQQQTNNSEITAVREAQAARVISAAEAEQRISQIRAQSTQQDVEQTRSQIEQITQLRQEGILSEEDAQSQLLDLETQLSELRLQSAEDQLELQEQLAAQAEERLNAELEGAQTLAEVSTGRLQIESEALNFQLSILSARGSLLEAQAQLQNQRTQFAIEDAERLGQSSQAEALRTQALRDQLVQLNRQQEVERQSLALKEQQAELDLRQKEISAEIAAREADIAIAIAQANGATAEQIANLEAIAGLRREQQDSLAQAANAQQQLNQLAREELSVRQQTARESAQRAVSEQQRSASTGGAGGTGSGGRSGSGLGSGNASSLGFLNNADGSLQAFNEATSALSGGRSFTFGANGATRELTEGRSTADLLQVALNNRENEFIGNILARSDRGGTVLGLQRISEQGAQGTFQAQQLAEALDAARANNNSAQIEGLTRAIEKLAASPRSLTVSAPDPVGSAGQILSQISRNNLEGLGV